MKRYFLDKGFLHIMDMWIQEQSPEVLSRAGKGCRRVKEEADYLALKNNLLHSSSRVDIDEFLVEEGQVLTARGLQKERGEISDCYLMRKLKCSRPMASAIMDEIGRADG